MWGGKNNVALMNILVELPNVRVAQYVNKPDTELSATISQQVFMKHVKDSTKLLVDHSLTAKMVLYAMSSDTDTFQEWGKSASFLSHSKDQDQKHGATL